MCCHSWIGIIGIVFNIYVNNIILMMCYLIKKDVQCFLFVKWQPVEVQSKLWVGIIIFGLNPVCHKLQLSAPWLLAVQNQLVGELLPTTGWMWRIMCVYILLMWDTAIPGRLWTHPSVLKMRMLSSYDLPNDAKICMWFIALHFIYYATMPPHTSQLCN